MTEEVVKPPEEYPSGAKGGPLARGALNATGGAIPLVGGFLAAVAGAWSEHEQAKVNRFFKAWIKMMRAQFEEQEQTVAEMMMRLDINDEEITKRVESSEFQSLVRKAFRDWAGAESDLKRAYVRNVLAHAASTKIVSDDIVRLFLEWLNRYSELHFRVVGVIYNQNGITRSEVWDQLGRGAVREDSADADLFKLLFRELTLGGLIRQHRETDAAGNYLRKPLQRRPSGAAAPRTMVSAFDEKEVYELTGLGQQFVHYAMTDIPPKIEFSGAAPSPGSSAQPVVGT